MSLFGLYNNSGFYKATVSKSLLGAIIIGHAATHFGPLASLQKYLICQIPDSMLQGEWWRLLTSNVAFIDTKDTICCLFLVYVFRVFERRYGSRKFASHLIGKFMLAIMLEWTLTQLIMINVEDTDFYSGRLSVGPLGAVLPWFVDYYLEIPSLHGVNFAMSAKTLTYLFALQVVVSPTSNIVAAVASIFAGLIYHFNGLWIRQWSVIPKCLASLVYRSIGWIIESGPPQENTGVNMGATLEIQRMQQMEAMEQQMMQQQARRNPLFRQVFGEQHIVPQQQQQQHQHQHQQQQQQPVTPPSEASIGLLVDMGFPRPRAIEALREAHNDLATATAILLRDS